MKEVFDTFMLVQLLTDDHHAASYTSDQVSAKQVLSLAHDQIVDASKRLAILNNAAETDEHEDAREVRPVAWLVFFPHLWKCGVLPHLPLCALPNNCILSA